MSRLLTRLTVALVASTPLAQASDGKRRINDSQVTVGLRKMRAESNSCDSRVQRSLELIARKPVRQTPAFVAQARGVVGHLREGALAQPAKRRQHRGHQPLSHSAVLPAGVQVTLCMEASHF
jgi:hypothetical protein